MIIDAHVHVDVKFGWRHTAEVVIAMMKEAGIDKAVITSYGEVPGEDPSTLDRLLETLRKHPDKFPAGFIRMNPWYGELAVQVFADAVQRRGIKGLKLHASSAPIWANHRFTLALIEKAAEFNAPVYFHAGTDPMSLPLQIGKAAKVVPGATIILGHWGGFYYADDAIKVAKKYQNIYLDTSIMPYPEQIRKGVKLLGPERVVFSSDMPGVSPIVELEKVRIAKLTEEERQRVLCLNVAEMLDMKVA